MGIDDNIPKIGTPTLKRSRNFPTLDDPKSPAYKTDRTALLSPNIDLITPETCNTGIGSTGDTVRHAAGRWGKTRVLSFQSR